MFLSDVLTALTAGLALIPRVDPEVSTATKVASKALVLGVQQAPGVAKAIRPSGTVDIILSHPDLELKKQELESVSSTLKDRMNAGLHEVMFDQTSFANFASSGLFSGAAAPSIADNEDALTIGLRTFILTRALTANKCFARVFPANADPYYSSHVQCFPNYPDHYNGYSYCWYNATTGRRYDLKNLQHHNMEWTLMNDIVTKQWAYPPFMFEAAVECAARGGVGDDTGVEGLIGFRDDGSLDMTCLSQLDTCTDWLLTEHDSCLTGLLNGECPLRTCQEAELGP